jgi:hypothetical protein
MEDLVAACNSKLPEGLRVTRAVAIDDRTPKLAGDLAAVALDVRIGYGAVVPADATAGRSGHDLAAIRASIANRFLNQPSADNQPRVLEADVVQSEDALRIRYTSSMLAQRIVTPEEVVAATVGDPASFRVPIKVVRLAQYVARDGRFVSPIDEGVVQASS